jgi:hypothetical protein
MHAAGKSQVKFLPGKRGAGKGSGGAANLEIPEAFLYTVVKVQVENGRKTSGRKRSGKWEKVY